MGKGVTESLFTQEATRSYIADNYKSELSDKSNEKEYTTKDYDNYKKNHEDELLSVDVRLLNVQVKMMQKHLRRHLQKMLLTLLLFAKSMHLISSIKLLMRMPVIQLNMALQRKTLRIKAMLLQLLMTRTRKAIRVSIGFIVQREKQAIHINTARP